MRLGYRVLVAVAVIAALLSHRASAQTYLTLAPDATSGSCNIADPGPGHVVTVYVLAKFSSGITGVQFSAPVPPSSGLVYINDQSTYSVGNSQSSVSVSFESCMTGTIVVMQMLFYRPNSVTPCVFYPVAPGAISTDCSFGEHPLNVGGVMINSDGTCYQAKNVAPADGAIDVPLTTSLSWRSGYSCFLGGSTLIFFGTTPNPPQVSYDETSPYAVGPLQPGTKYYWKIADPGAGPVWSFTTTSVVATRPTTWGAIKALYR